MNFFSRNFPDFLVYNDYIENCLKKWNEKILENFFINFRQIIYLEKYTVIKLSRKIR